MLPHSFAALSNLATNYTPANPFNLSHVDIHYKTMPTDYNQMNTSAHWPGSGKTQISERI